MSKNLKFCPNCNITGKNAELKSSFAATGTRFSKEDVMEFNKGFLWGLKPKDKEEFDICPFCGEKVIDSGITTEEFDVLEEASNCNRRLLDAMVELKRQDIIEYELKMSQFRNAVQQQKDREKQQEATLKPKCPKCGCTEFVPLRKKWSLFSGFATNKVDMVCKNCGAMKK